MPSRPRLDRVLGFVLFSHGWTWGFWAVPLMRGGDVWALPNAAFLAAGALGVPLGGLVMTAREGGLPAVARLGRRTVDPRRVPPAWWAAVLLLFPAVTVVAAGLVALLDPGAEALDPAGAAARWGSPAGFLAAAGFGLLAGPLPEEIGWRGFALHHLQRRWSSLRASLVVGLLWATWHFPLYFLEGYYAAFGASAPDPVEHAAGVMVSSVLYAWVYSRTGRSLLAVILLHFTQNFSGELLGASPRTDGYVLPLLFVLALVVVAVEGRDLGLRRRSSAERDGG